MGTHEPFTHLRLSSAQCCWWVISDVGGYIMYVSLLHTASHRPCEARPGPHTSCLGQPASQPFVYSHHAVWKWSYLQAEVPIVCNLLLQDIHREDVEILQPSTKAMCVLLCNMTCTIMEPGSCRGLPSGACLLTPSFCFQERTFETLSTSEDKKIINATRVCSLICDMLSYKTD